MMNIALHETSLRPEHRITSGETGSHRTMTMPKSCKEETDELRMLMCCRSNFQTNSYPQFLSYLSRYLANAGDNHACPLRMSSPS
jgi:hypothetical protein